MRSILRRRCTRNRNMAVGSSVGVSWLLQQLARHRLLLVVVAAVLCQQLSCLAPLPPPREYECGQPEQHCASHDSYHHTFVLARRG